MPEQLPSVSSPYHKRVVENAAVHADSAVDLGVDDRGCSDDPAVGRHVSVGAGLRDLLRIFQVIPIELFHFHGSQYVAGAHFTCFVLHDRVYGDRIILDQLIKEEMRQCLRRVEKMISLFLTS